MAVLSEFQQALERRDFEEAQRLRDLRTSIEAGTYSGWFSPGDDKIGLSGHAIQPIFIYPKVDLINERDSGKFVDTGKNKYIWTGDWQLSDVQHKELDKNLSRALSETGLSVLPTQVKNSRKLLREWQSQNDQYGSTYPEEELGVANRHMPEGVVPYYIVRGMGGFAGATPGTAEFGNPYALVGDAVIESLAGFEGLNAFTRIKMDEGMSEAEAKYLGSRQSQMGTVLHEAMHMVGALPHTADEGGLQDYTVNYGGQHGEEFMHAITADMKGKRTEDIGQAMALVMGDPANYGWGTDANPDGVVADPITSKQEFEAIARAPEHQHPHRVEFPHESPEQTIPTSLDPIPISKTPEPIESKETMAEVPFRKNANGQWEVFGNGQWQSTPELQQVLQDVESVRAVKASDGSTDYEFLYGTDPGGITGDPTGIWTLDDIEQRYNEAVLASGGSQVTPAGSPTGGGAADLYESWYSVNTTTLPDMYMRDDAGDIIMNEEYIDSAGNTVPAQPVIDPDKMERVIEILRQQGAWEIQEPTVFSVPGVQDNFVRIGDKIFKSSPPEPVAKEYQPGVVPETGPGSINLPGYDILQDREGGLTPYAERYKPTYHLDTTTMTPFIQQPDGSLEVADVPTIDELITQYLVTGQSEKAVAMANFRDRPSPIEYFQAAMEWARTPADIFTVSAIVRGMFEPELGEIGDVRRVGAPPSWARDAWIALQSSMGVPAQNMSSEPGDAEGSFVAKGGDASVVPTVQSEFGIGNIEPTDSNVTAADAKALFQDTGVLAVDADIAASGDADDLFSELGVDIGGGEIPGGGIPGGGPPGETSWATVTLYNSEGSPVNVQESLAEGLLSGGMYGETPNWNVEEDITEDPYTSFYGTGGEELFADIVPSEPSQAGLSLEEFLAAQQAQQPAATSSSMADLWAGMEDIQEVSPAPISELEEGGGYGGPGADISFEDAVRKYGWDAGPKWGVDVGIGSPTFGTFGNLPMAAAQQYPDMPQEETELIDMWRNMAEGNLWAGDVATFATEEPTPVTSATGLPTVSVTSAGLTHDPYSEEWFPGQVDENAVAMAAAQRQMLDNPMPEELFQAPQTFIQEAEPMDVIGTNPGMLASDLGQGRELEFTSPQTFTVPAGPVDVVGTDPGMLASDLGPGRELPFEDYEEATPPTPFYDAVPVAPIEYADPYIYEPVVSNLEIYPEDYADGGRTNERLSLVGESGPELALFPRGTEIIPLDREMQPNQKRRLRRRGAFANAIDSFQFGGMVGGMGPEVSDLPLGAQTMPAGVTEMLTGRPTRRPRSLFRPAGLRTPSAQTISNLLPEEIEVYQEMGRLAGIPEKAFEREFRSMVPMGQGGTSQARFTPRSIGRTRYGTR